MVKQPRLLVLDEPCNGLDSLHREKVLAALDRIVAENRTQLLYVTHRRRDMPRCIGHCLVLNSGRVVAIKDNY